jgi:uncharacterized protein (DUF2141 family)
MQFEATLFASLVTCAMPAAAATLTTEIDNVRNARGHVHVDVCPQAHFLKEDCPYSGEAAAHSGVTTVVVPDVPPGRYAVQVFHDENDNHRVDRALFGIPKEGVGFSNDAPIRLGPPKWEDSAFEIEGDTRIRLKMRYFLGSAGPTSAAR